MSDKVPPSKDHRSFYREIKQLKPSKLHQESNRRYQNGIKTKAIKYPGKLMQF